MNLGLMGSALVFLATSVIMVPISKRLGLGSILGYLLGGILIGPWALGLITNVQDILHFSELGVVLLLFIIGLELDPKKLWTMRLPIFGFGGLQVVGNTFLFTIAAMLMGLPFSAALVVGMGFSLSSTALALQVMQEKGFQSTSGGQTGFSILLFQDIAVILMIALLPALAPVADSLGAQQGSSILESSGYFRFFKVIGLLLAIILIGRLLLRPILRWIAATHSREVFTAFALLLVLGSAGLMVQLNLSMALGALIAGVLLADSEYRHALETDIEPFKGLLLGLFFISVGMSLDFGAVMAKPLQVLVWLSLIYLIKSSFHFLLAKLAKVPKNQAPYFALIISQVGEFAFVLFGSAVTMGILPKQEAGVLVAAVALSMFATPVLSALFEKLVEPKLDSKSKMPMDTIADESPTVLIAGFGRFGQIVGRLLYANRIKATVLDFEPDQIELLRKFGFKVYYGDATRLELLEAAGIRSAKVLVVAIDNVEECLKLIDLVKEHFPSLTIFARARNVQHVYELMDRNIAIIERETFESSLKMGTDLLHHLGWPAHQAVRAAHKFRAHNIQMLKDLHQSREDQADLVAKAKQARKDLEEMFAQEDENLKSQQGNW